MKSLLIPVCGLLCILPPLASATTSSDACGAWLAEFEPTAYASESNVRAYLRSLQESFGAKWGQKLEIPTTPEFDFVAFVRLAQDVDKRDFNGEYALEIAADYFAVQDRARQVWHQYYTHRPKPFVAEPKRKK